VLKGVLAPVYDDAKKRHFKKTFPHAAQGKYDVYGLFLERTLQLLKQDGRFALLTQSTYLDKEWAKGLRSLLASKTELDSIIDMNPFGQLFFSAMNSPCVTAAVNTQEEASGDCLCVMSEPPSDFRELDKQRRREKVVGTIREVLAKLTKKKRAKILFASGARVSRQVLRNTAKDRWDISGGSGKRDFPEEWFTAAELLEMRQGVTPGGCLDVFLMDKGKAKLLELEDDLVRKAIKSKQLSRWRVEWKDRVLFYPYHAKEKKSETEEKKTELEEKKSEPAFTIQWDEIEDKKLKERLTKLGIEDALDFDQQIDSRETEIIREVGINAESVRKLLKHRISLGVVKHPKDAEYLVGNYERLQGRVFKKKNIRHFNRRWYEYAADLRKIVSTFENAYNILQRDYEPGRRTRRADRLTVQTARTGNSLTLMADRRWTSSKTMCGVFAAIKPNSAPARTRSSTPTATQPATSSSLPASSMPMILSTSRLLIITWG